MHQSQLRSPWEYSKSLLSLAPTAGNGPQVHAVIDRTGYASAIVDAAYSCSGVPTGGLMVVKLQDSDDGTNFADLVINGNVVIVSTTVRTTANGGLLSLNAHLGAARRYVRAVTNGSPTGGTSPVVSAAATIRLFGPDRLPAL